MLMKFEMRMHKNIFSFVAGCFLPKENFIYNDSNNSTHFAY